MILSSLISAPLVSAEDYDTKIDEAKTQVENNNQQIDSLNETINSLESESQNTEAALASINDEITNNENLIKETVERLQTAHNNFDTLQVEIAELEVLIEKRNGQLEEQARKIQVDGQTANYIEFVLDSESITDVIGRIDVVTNLVQSNKELMEAQMQDKKSVVTKQAEVEKTITQQNALAEELEQVSADLEQQQLEKEVQSLRSKAAIAGISELLKQAEEIEGVLVLAKEIEVDSADTLRNIGNSVREQISSGIAWLATKIGEKNTLICVVSDDLIERGIKAGDMVNEVAILADGRGGGKSNMAQAGIKDPEKISGALKFLASEPILIISRLFMVSFC